MTPMKKLISFLTLFAVFSITAHAETQVSAETTTIVVVDENGEETTITVPAGTSAKIPAGSAVKSIEGTATVTLGDGSVIATQGSAKMTFSVILLPATLVLPQAQGA